MAAAIDSAGAFSLGLTFKVERFCRKYALPVPAQYFADLCGDYVAK